MANNMIEKINERYNDDSFLGLSEVFDSAIIGVEENEMRLIYSVSKCLKVFEEDMTKLDATPFSYGQTWCDQSIIYKYTHNSCLF
jgi:hypothetical protein